jgi:hypothetical protein
MAQIGARATHFVFRVEKVVAAVVVDLQVRDLGRKVAVAPPTKLFKNVAFVIEGEVVRRGVGVGMLDWLVSDEREFGPTTLGLSWVHDSGYRG